MPTACVSFEFPAPIPAADVLQWLAAALAPAGLARAPAAWLADSATPSFLGPIDPLTRAGDHPRLKVAYGPGGALGTATAYLVELQFAPTAAAGVGAIRVWPPGADYQPSEPWGALVDHDSVLSSFQTAFAQLAGVPAVVHSTRQSAAQAVTAALALMASDAGANWRVQMLRLIPGGHRQSAENPAAGDTWVVRFSLPGDKEATAVAHVDDASGTAARG